MALFVLSPEWSRSVSLTRAPAQRTIGAFPSSSLSLNVGSLRGTRIESCTKCGHCFPADAWGMFGSLTCFRVHHLISETEHWMEGNETADPGTKAVAETTAVNIGSAFWRMVKFNVKQLPYPSLA